MQTNCTVDQILGFCIDVWIVRMKAKYSRASKFRKLVLRESKTFEKKPSPLTIVIVYT